jgi:hypothetical protein
MSDALNLHSIARALGGQVSGAQVRAPGPGHGRGDDSLSVKLSATSPDGFLAHSFAGDDWRVCRDYVREKLGLPRAVAARPRPSTSGAVPVARNAPEAVPDEAERAKAQWLWRQRRSVENTIAEVYLRKARGYGGAIPETLGFLPGRGDHAPTLIAAFGMTSEPEPGVLAIADDAVRAVQLIKLKADGSGKADVEPQKIIIGRGALGSPIVLAPPNDLLGLVICEGIEDALSTYEATGLGAWAAGGATRLPALADAVPAYVDFVTVQPDDDDAGLCHGADLAARLRTRGFEAILKPLSWERAR